MLCWLLWECITGECFIHLKQYDTTPLISRPECSPLIRNLCVRWSLTVIPQVWLQSQVSQADNGAVARHYEGNRRDVWHQHPHLFPVPQVAAHVQHFFLHGQLWFYHHPSACLRPLAQPTCECELQRTGDTDWSCKWSLFVPWFKSLSASKLC